MDAQTRGQFSLGIVTLTARYFEQARSKNQRLKLRVIGALELADDVSPELADATIERITVVGSLRATPAVVNGLGDRVHKGLAVAR